MSHCIYIRPQQQMMTKEREENTEKKWLTTETKIADGKKGVGHWGQCQVICYIHLAHRRTFFFTIKRSINYLVI